MYYINNDSFNKLLLEIKFNYDEDKYLHKIIKKYYLK